MLLCNIQEIYAQKISKSILKKLCQGSISQARTGMFVYELLNSQVALGDVNVHVDAVVSKKYIIILCANKKREWSC